MKTVFILFGFLLCSAHSFAQSDFVINTLETPFSRAGSYMALSTAMIDQQEVLFLREICGRRLWASNRIFKIEALDGDQVLNASYRTTPGRLSIITEKGIIDICFATPDMLRIRGKGPSLRLTQVAPYDASSLVIPVRPGQWRLQMGGFPHYVFTTLTGNPEMRGSRLTVNMISDSHRRRDIEMVLTLRPDADNYIEAALEQYVSGWMPGDYSQTFDQCETNALNDFNTWQQNAPLVSENYSQTAQLANYINWSCVVNPRGFCKRRVMLSSKNNMHASWTWDNCFFSLCQAYQNPASAWESFMVFFDHQDANGMVPNLLTDVNAMWGFSNPQLWGWTLREMMRVNPALGSKKQLSDVYEPLCRITNFFFTFQDDDHDGLPQYQHGNDCGWDNVSAFDVGMSVESPDLCAYLVIQMDLLAEIAKKLGKKADSQNWKHRADTLLSTMIAQLWDGDTFRVRRTDDRAYKAESRSLLVYMPLILGERLPVDIREKMVASLRADSGLFTPIGLASESINSSLYLEDGYWRGSVWSPPSLLLAAGLRDAGYEDFAKEIARRYCDNCAKNGFGENFNAKTGVSQKDRSMPWTAAIFLILAHEYLLE